MSTGAGHYREAERLLAEVRKGYESGPTMSYQNESRTLAEAQVHATLAHVAAQVEAHGITRVSRNWSAAIS